ncbi:MAG: Smr/MutS family protein [Pseudomonadota bacterium]
MQNTPGLWSGFFTGETMPKAPTDLIEENDPEVVDYPLDGVLDLHMFAPRDAADLVREYLDACHQAGIREVRIIHGKGKGVMRRTVHALLEDHPLVSEFGLDPGSSGWGATLVHLKPTP